MRNTPINKDFSLGKIKDPGFWEYGNIDSGLVFVSVKSLRLDRENKVNFKSAVYHPTDDNTNLMPNTVRANNPATAQDFMVSTFV